MAEREALEREIEKLQNLIKDHKRVHGDAPSSSVQSQWFCTKSGLGTGRGHNTSYIPSYSHQPQPYAPHSSSQWKKKYSLNNKTTRAPGGRPSQISEANLNKTRQVKGVAPDACSLSGVSKVLHEGTSKASTVPSCSVMGKESSLGSNKVPDDGEDKSVLEPTSTNIESITDLAGLCSLKCGQQSGLDGKMRQNTTSNIKCSATLFVPSSEESSAFNKKQTAPPQVKSYFTSTVSSNTTVIMANKDAPSSSMPTSKVRLKADLAPKIPAALSPHKKSRFTWVKSQGTETSQTKLEIHQFSPISLSASTASPGMAKQTPTSSKKLHRKLSFSSSTPRTSKYSWVSSSCSPTTAAKTALAKLPHKLFSPKALKVPGKMAKEGLESKKLITTGVVSKRAKISGAASTSHAGHGSRYSWKAVAATSSSVVRGSTPRSSRKSSVYRWTAQKDEKDSASPVSRVQHSPSAALSSSGFKLRSRTKIIRRFSNSPTSERRPSVGVVTIRSRYSLRRRAHSPVKTPSGVRRGQSRGLVSLGRHKLRRLSPSSSITTPWSSRTGPFSLPVRNSASHRVIKTHYKIDTRRTHLQHHNSTLYYRVKKIQSARFLLQSRLRATPDRQWRGRGMRWIGGELYRVSANKLSRTHPSTPSNRSGKLFSPQDVSFGSSSTYRTSNTRHVASRAVQKSLAIIRQARQKKQQAKQYCMYFNRFGKCNRGSACPYIHDPDKVAVCTRFLRGTCKQTDGTCPFSHKVSKEKMPVCSYFLKGICNNSSCPYSHVYVSRKAAVCQDFIRGYCPQGEKCKKKHTLVCPDFSRTGVCPQGTKCKLQHRQRVKRAGSSLSSGSAKRARSRESTKSPRPEPESTPAEDGTPKTCLAKLPSFISLSSSPETPEGGVSPSCPPGAGPEGTGKKLHIKPRF
ncbi:zinc finger CCCH domain-containing protein 3 [Ictalurus punctatus]|uniref:Zinc finger CCCH domain-containing protein 3 n=1 Tax=Ictalurus punctatus TaxID=7998 RepID=A0A2D0RYB3_ICTPU|nr:zinc finger CCCH domain-containing protein 3 [Ictalurus punctatus]